MAYPHAIRLRGPWEYQPLARFAPQPDGTLAELTDGLPPAGRVELPSDWNAVLGPDFRGRVLLRRRFGLPSQLDPHERVWLLVDLPGPEVKARVNGHEIRTASEVQLFHHFDLTDRLQARNELELVVVREPERETILGPGRFPDVRLEVRASHFVDRLRVEVCATDAECQVHLGGRVIGAALEDLELIATLAGRELAYQPLGTSSCFVLTAPAEGIPSWSDLQAGLTPSQLEVKLLHRGVRLWQAVRPLVKRRVDWSRAEATLTIDGRPFALPAGVFPIVDWLRNAFGPDPDRLFTTAFVFREDEYLEFDRHGLKLIQQVPALLAAELTPRLAHHPSIVAWSADEAEVDSLAAKHSPPCAAARPWIRM